MADLGIAGISNAIEARRTLALTVYRAVDNATGARVQVKVLSREATSDVRARFDYDQARMIELADHPCIVDVLAFGYTPTDRPYVVTAVVRGGSMADHVGSGLDGPGVLALGIRVAGALESAHRRDVVHGDLRPEDILVDARGEPAVADFGFAMVTGMGADRATDVQRIAHAAPEQLATHLPIPSSDVYTLGSILYALIAGSPAFVDAGDTSMALVKERILGEPPPTLRGGVVPDQVIDAIERAMSKDPADRFPSADAFGTALQQAEMALGLAPTPMTVLGPEGVDPRPIVDQTLTVPPPPRPPGAAPAAPTATVPRTTLAPAPPPTSTPPAPPVTPRPTTGGRPAQAPLVGGIVLALVLAVIAVVLVSGGGDGGDDDARAPVTRDERRTTTTLAPPPSFPLVTVSDDSNTITIGRLERWADVDGRPLNRDGAENPDLIAAVDADAFLQGATSVSGIEVTVIGDVTDARAEFDRRVADRGIDDACTSSRPEVDIEVAGFAGVLQRFDDCDGNAIVVFAGIAGSRALVAEVHLVDPEDEEALDAVLASIAVA